MAIIYLAMLYALTNYESAFLFANLPFLSLLIAAGGKWFSRCRGGAHAIDGREHPGAAGWRQSSASSSSRQRSIRSRNPPGTDLAMAIFRRSSRARRRMTASS